MSTLPYKVTIEVLKGKYPQCVRCKHYKEEVAYNKYFSNSEKEIFCFNCLQIMCNIEAEKKGLPQAYPVEERKFA